MPQALTHRCFEGVHTSQKIAVTQTKQRRSRHCISPTAVSNSSSALSAETCMQGLGNGWGWGSNSSRCEDTSSVRCCGFNSICGALQASSLAVRTCSRTSRRNCKLHATSNSNFSPSASVRVSSPESSTNNVPKHHHQELPLHQLEPQQQIQSMQQLLQQQQSAISLLQRELQQLRWSIETCPNTPATLAYEGSYKGMDIEDFRALPDKIIMVRHAESQGNVDARTYSTTPDYEVPLSARGWEQAVACGNEMRTLLEAEYGKDYKLFFMTSPYCRTRQTFVGVRQAFPDENFAGVQEEVQLREQDFGNFQDPVKIKNDLAERNRFGRFYYRFPDGESGSDVYNRISIFEDHLIRDMKAGKFSHNTNICLVTHGLTMRVFLMRWFNWTVESFLQVYNPPNAKPIVVEKMSEDEFIKKTTKLHVRRQTLQVKQAYRLRKESMASLKMSPTATVENIDLGFQFQA